MSYTSTLERAEKGGVSLFRETVAELLCLGKEKGVQNVSHRALIQARYVAHILDGDSHLMADMLAHAKPPQSKTDREFLRGHCNGSQFEDTPYIGDGYRQMALENGVNPKGKIYLGTLARFPGDPEAWVSGRGDVQKVCEMRGWGCEGSVNVKVREQLNPPKAPALAPDIVQGHVENQLAMMDPGDAARADVGEMAHNITEKMKPHWSE